jgi:hypothetical protein
MARWWPFLRTRLAQDERKDARWRTAHLLMAPLAALRYQAALAGAGVTLEPQLPVRAGAMAVRAGSRGAAGAGGVG